MIGCSLNAVWMPLFFWLNGAVSGPEMGSASCEHPDHGAPFVEQLSGQWVISSKKGEERRLRMYEDGRFAFKSDAEWTAGSYVILRSDERQKGVLRMEYYLDGNLHLQEVRCEIYFAEHARDSDGDAEHNHSHSEEHGGGHETAEAEEGHHHEYLRVEVLPAAEQRLNMAGDYLHQH
ncbi:MAG: hypothetical protein L7S67_08345 [Flavobacteriales bacterium]|nr:hypothetical protein [Flavobacteriales bacterium]